MHLFLYLSSMSNPDRVPKWFGLFLLIYGANYVCGLLLAINSLKLNWKVLHPPPDGWHTIINIGLLYLDIIYTVLQIALSSIVLFLLLRQNRWGWILAVGGACAFLTTRIAQSDIAIRSPKLIQDHWFGLVWPMVIDVVFLIYLLRRDTTHFFRVSAKIRKYSILIGVAASLAVTLICRIIYRM